MNQRLERTNSTSDVSSTSLVRGGKARGELLLDRWLELGREIDVWPEREFSYLLSSR